MELLYICTRVFSFSFLLCVLGPECARLVAQKSKGMPVITFLLTKLVDSAVNEAIENMSFGLFKALKYLQTSILQGFFPLPFLFDIVIAFFLLPVIEYENIVGEILREIIVIILTAFVFDIPSLCMNSYIISIQHNAI